METHNQKNLLDMIEEIRSLSFSVLNESHQLFTRQSKIEKITQDFQEVMSLRTEFEKKSRELNENMTKVREELHNYQR